MTEQLPDLWIKDDGQFGVSWPEGRPDWVRMSTDLLEDIIQQLNDARQAMQ